MTELLQDLGRQVLVQVLPLLATIVAVLLIRLLYQLARKVGIDIGEAQQDRLRDRVVQILLSVEEAAHRRRHDEPLSSEQKNMMALEAIAREAPHVPMREAQRAIDAALPDVRARLTPAAQVFSVPAAGPRS